MYYLHWEDWPMVLPYPALLPITLPSLDSTPYTRHIYTTHQAEHRHTPIFNNDTLCGRVRPPLSIKSKFTPKDTELSFVTAQSEESANGNA